MAYLYNHLDLEKDEGLGEIQALIGWRLIITLTPIEKIDQIIRKRSSVALARVDMIMSCQSHKLLSDTLVFRVEGPVDN